jgi:5-methylcytosine-specific restriction endonuclease McrA
MTYEPEKKKECDAKHYERNKEKIKEQNRKNYEQNKEDRIKYEKEKRDMRNKNAYDSITSKSIVDHKSWDQWCNEIKRCAKKSKHPYSDEFTNDIMFDMMAGGCYYCGDVATTIDRLDSTLDHTLDNCVGCCGPCNNSKGAADPSTFVRKSYYMAREEYIDEVTDVWHTNKAKPSMCHYAVRASKKGVSFELTKKKFENLIIGNCEYCHRTPTTWFGIDRVVPSLGYVDDNVVPCCFDCNVDKHEQDVQMAMNRNERIAKRVDDGVIFVEECQRIILHTGTKSNSKKVCVYGQVYDNQHKASKAIGKNDNYVCTCIYRGIYTDNIFRISDEFYEVYKDSDVYITKDMFVTFDLAVHAAS